MTARRGDVIVGTATQVISVLASLFTPSHRPLALIFAGLWVTCCVLRPQGRRRGCRAGSGE